jgi:hypothetical protein
MITDERMIELLLKSIKRHNTPQVLVNVKGVCYYVKDVDFASIPQSVIELGEPWGRPKDEYEEAEPKRGLCRHCGALRRLGADGGTVFHWRFEDGFPVEPCPGSALTPKPEVTQ